MNTQFQSGITLTQARKDAKKLAKSEGVPLHKALNSIAEQHHGQSWSKSVRSLNLKPTVFSLTLKALVDNKQVTIQLTQDEPLCIIDGYPGSGKTIAALTMAEYHLKQGFAVHYFAGYDMANRVSPQSQDLALDLALAFEREYEGFYIHRGCDLNKIEDADYEENSLVIIDEANAFNVESQFSSVLIDLFKTQKCFVVMLSQHIESLDNIDELLIYLACILFGKRDNASMKRNVSFLKQFLSFHPRVGQYLARKRLGVSIPKSESRFFCIHKDCADVVCFPLPAHYF